MPRSGPKMRTRLNVRRPPKGGSGPDWPIPPHLGDIARGEFVRLVGVLHARGTLEVADPALVECAATCYEAFRLAQATLDEDGHFIASEFGLKVHPGLKVVLDMTNRIRQFMGDLGLTPRTCKL